MHRDHQPQPDRPLVPSPATLRIRAANDRFRAYIGTTGGRYGDHVYVTQGVAAHGAEFVERAIQAASTYFTFTPQNDPYGEHDFGDFVLEGEQLFWKIDYLDLELEHGSEDPSDLESTRRVMTVMLAAEY
jgi:hypothetical protein